MTSGLRIAVLAVVAAVLLPASGPARADDAIRIGWTPWADGIFVTRLAARVIEERLDQDVELVEMPISEQYQAIAVGRLDAMLMSWQPDTHAPYLRRVANRVEHLGVLYDGARLGWAVPEYVPADEVTSIADLAEHAERFDRRVIGIDPDAGLTRLSRQGLKRYGLDDFSLETSSGPEMTARLGEAVEAGKWIVVTAWNPHWIFAAHELRYLDDPEGALGGPERVHVLARDGFYAERPEVARVLTRMHIDLSELEQVLLEVQQYGYPDAIDRYLATHPAQVRYWVSQPADE